MNEAIGGRQRLLPREETAVDFNKKWGVLIQVEDEVPDVLVFHFAFTHVLSASVDAPQRAGEQREGSNGAVARVVQFFLPGFRAGTRQNLPGSRESGGRIVDLVAGGKNSEGKGIASPIHEIWRLAGG